MLAALLQRELGDGFQVESAGTSMEAVKGHHANGFAINLLKKRGIDLSGHRSRWIRTMEDLPTFTHFVCVDPETVNRVLPSRDRPVILANGNKGGIPDPFAGGWPAYKACLATCDLVVPEIAEYIRNGK